jgi:protein-disulfide isomerase
VKKIRETYQGKVRVVIKNYPYQYRDYSQIAAEASLAAGDQGKYWEMHDLLIARSPKLDRASLIQYARELGLDTAQFTAALDSKKYAALIERDKQLAVSMDLFNTPTFFVNGRKIVGERTFPQFKKIIDEELKKKTK